MRACGTLGMNLFFVLSGFIIHYNYSSSLTEFSVPNFTRFVIARISRLYPLLALFVLFEFLTQDYILQASDQYRVSYTTALPFFLTFSQSWLYIKLNALLSLTYAFRNSSITWSVSTEFFMYLAYPLLLLSSLRTTDGLAMRVVKAVVGAVILSFAMRWITNSQTLMDQLGTRWFGPNASQSANASYSFAVWLIFLSPYMRLGEFFIGALFAHLFIYLENKKPTRLEVAVVGWGSILCVLFIVHTLLPPEFRLPYLDRVFTRFGYYAFVALIVFSSARYSNFVLCRFFSWKPFIWAGEASYSIYLFHIVVYNGFSTPAGSQISSIMRAFASVFLVITVARIFFVYYEMPMRKWLKSRLQKSAHLLMPKSSIDGLPVAN
jgi:peptidoglycan/LPS O-acetylase OafA/YrhL